VFSVAGLDPDTGVESLATSFICHRPRNTQSRCYLNCSTYIRDNADISDTWTYECPVAIVNTTPIAKAWYYNMRPHASTLLPTLDSRPLVPGTILV